MKICTNEKTEISQLTFKDLQKGEVFCFVIGYPAIKDGNEGYTYLKTGNRKTISATARNLSEVFPVAGCFQYESDS